MIRRWAQCLKRFIWIKLFNEFFVPMQYTRTLYWIMNKKSKKMLVAILLGFLLVTTIYNNWKLNEMAASNAGILNVGFDVDDTILFSRDVFLNIPEDKRNPTDYGWVNMQDEKLSLFIEPTVELIKYFKNNGHNIFIITARSGENGHYLAKLLSDSLGLNIKKNENLFF